MDTVTRALYRGLLRGAREFDRHPVLKALIARGRAVSCPNHPIPAAIDDAVATFLGSEERELFWPSMQEPPSSVTGTVRQIYQSPAAEEQLDSALAGLRYLGNLLSIADDHELRGAEGITAVGAAVGSRTTVPHNAFAAAAFGRPAMEASLADWDAAPGSPPQLESGAHRSAATAAAVGGGLQLLSAPEPGALLLAHPLQNGWFCRSAVLVCSNSPVTGAYGLSINRTPSASAAAGDQSLQRRLQRIVGHLKFLDSDDDEDSDDEDEGGNSSEGRLRFHLEGLQVEELGELLRDLQETFGDDSSEEGESCPEGGDGADAEAPREESHVAHGGGGSSWEVVATGGAGEEQRRSGAGVSSPQGREAALAAPTVAEGGSHSGGGEPCSAPSPSDKAGGSAADDTAPAAGGAPGSQSSGSALAERAVQATGAMRRRAVRSTRRARRPQNTSSSRLAARLGKVLGGRISRIWSGGPVENAGQWLHRCPDLSGEVVVPPSGPDAGDGLFVGGVLERIGDPAIADRLKARGVAVFDGECSWAPGQLEDELARGVWLVVRSPAVLAAITAAQGRDVEDVWGATMQALGGEYAALARIPAHVVSNEIHSMGA